MDKLRALIPYFLHILLHVFIFIGFTSVVPLGDVYFNYIDFVKQVLGVKDVVVCPPNCTIDLAPQRRDSRAVIVVDNPSDTLVALSVNTTQGQGKVIITGRSTRLEVFFNGGLYVDVYPLYPLSDAEPRSVYLPSGGNLTIRVIPPAMGGTLPIIITVVGTVIGIMASLGIIRHVTRTPAVDVIGNTFPTYLPPLIFWLYLSLMLATVLQVLYGSTLLNVLKAWLPSILMTIYITIILLKTPGFEGKIFLFSYAMPFLLPLLLTPSPLFYFVSFIIITNPIILLFFKSLAVVEDMERAKKVGVLHLYDLVVAFWIFQWLINPYLAIFRLSFFLSIQLITHYIIVVLVYLLFFILLLYLAIKGPGFGMLFLSTIPFVFNEELVARVEFCRKALDWPTRVKVYPEDDESVVGFVVKCDIEKIAIGDGKSMRVFSWGDLRQIEL